MSEIDKLTLSQLPPTPGWFIYDSAGEKFIDCATTGLVRGICSVPAGCGHLAEFQVLVPVPPEAYEEIMHSDADSLWDEVKYEMLAAISQADAFTGRCSECVPPPDFPDDSVQRAPWQPLPEPKDLGDLQYHLSTL